MRALTTRTYPAVLLFTFLLLTSTLACVAPNSAVAETGSRITGSRTVSLEVKIVFVGINPNDIDTTYMSWSENLPARINEEVLIGGKDMGVEFDVKYRFAFTDSAFKTKLADYLNSISETADIENPYFWYYKKVGDTYEQTWMKVRSTQYDANEVEQWLTENSRQYGGMLEYGWTFIVMYLPELPSATYKTMKEYQKQDIFKTTTSVHPHYYKIPAEDRDLGYKLRYREFATAWGNHDRLWFLDLSAGPSFWDASSTFPLQVAIEDQNIKLGSTYGKSWLTEYLADYVWGAVKNFAVPSSTYYPTYSGRYNIIVTVFDDRTDDERIKVPVESTINADSIKQAFEDLAPYVTTDVQLDFRQLKDYSDLRSLVKDNHEKLKEAVFHPDVDVVDLRPIYRYLQSNLKDFATPIKRDEAEFTIPLFAFVFSGKTYFTYSNKWDHEHINDPERQSLSGIALGDIALVGTNQWDFTRGDEVGQKGKGLGMTSTVIHELGHMVGLMHPHEYDNVGDFAYGVMSYFTEDYQFGQSDKDFIRRAHVDEILLNATETLEKAKLELSNKIESPDVNQAIVQAEELLKRVETEYGRMDFTNAVKAATEAKARANMAFDNAVKLPLATQPLQEEIQTLKNEINQLRMYIIITLVVGVAAGSAVAYLVLARRIHRKEVPGLPAQRVETNLKPLTKPRRHCSTCGNEILPVSVFCERCGARQPEPQ